MTAITDASVGHQAFRLADAEFHSALPRGGRNEMFIPYDMMSFDEPREAVLADHRAVDDAVREGDSMEAAQLMAEHIRQTRE